MNVTILVIDRKIQKLRSDLQLASRLHKQQPTNLELRRNVRKYTNQIAILEEIKKDVNRAVSMSSIQTATNQG